MPHPTNHLDPQHQLGREDAHRLLDMAEMMRNPTQGGSCRVPLPRSTRALDASGLSAREALVMPPGIVANSALARAGAMLLQLTPQQQHEVQLVATDLSKTGGWGGSVDVSPPTPANVTKPRLLMAHINVSVGLWKTAPVLAGALVEAQLHAAIGAAIDAAALVGDGIVEPLGLFNNGAVTAVTGAVTVASIAAREKAIAAAYCETSPIGIIVAPTARETMRTTFQNGTGSNSAWNALSDMNRQSSPHCPAASAIVGDFSQVIVSTWGDVQLQMNPYSLDATGMVRVLLTMTADIQILRPGAFGTIVPA
jgi:hypothetical protein